ncbi:hypothetical protein L9F63_018920, partial [Diploptera punctata]
MTLLKAGKMQELAEQLSIVKLDIVALQEIRWNGNGIINKKRTGQAGTGFFVKKQILHTVIDFKPYNARICKLRIQSKYNKITLINTYAPTEEKAIEIKEEVYEELQNAIKEIPKRQHTIHETTNTNGEMLCHFAIQNNLKIMSTHFQHKQIHKATWISPDHNIMNQIDHVLITRSKYDLIEDVRTLRGPNIDSDHFLVRIIFKQSLPTKYKKKYEQTFKWNKQNLQNSDKLKQYKEVLISKIKDLPENENENINDKWNKLKNTIIEAAEQTIQKQEKTERNEWWDNDCREIIDQKMKQEEQRNFRMNDVGKFLNNVKNFNYCTKSTTLMCKDAEGTIQSDATKVLKRWREHFINVFKADQIQENSLTTQASNE